MPGRSCKLMGTVADKFAPDAAIRKLPAHLAAVLLATKVSVLEPLPGMGITDGEKLAVTPAGRPLVLRATVEPKLPTACVVTTRRTDTPGLRLRLLAFALTLSPGGVVTVTGIEIVSFKVPLVPVKVSE